MFVVFFSIYLPDNSLFIAFHNFTKTVSFQAQTEAIENGPEPGA